MCIDACAWTEIRQDSVKTNRSHFVGQSFYMCRIFLATHFPLFLYACTCIYSCHFRTLSFFFLSLSLSLFLPLCVCMCGQWGSTTFTKCQILSIGAGSSIIDWCPVVEHFFIFLFFMVSAATTTSRNRYLADSLYLIFLRMTMMKKKEK